MINRRIIRIKVMQTLFAYTFGSIDSIDAADKDLNYSFERLYDLYFVVLKLVIDINDFAKQKIEKAKQKLLPTEEDLNPNTKFIENRVVKQLRANLDFNYHLDKRPFTWTKYPEALKTIFEKFTQTEQYKTYMASGTSSYKEDKNLINFFVQFFLPECRMFYMAIEDESIYWSDNVDFILLTAGITIERFKERDNENKRLPKMFKNNDDREFAFKLLHKTILNKTEYNQIIKENVLNWDFERIAALDKVILLMAITELLEFEEIPVKVTLNEYIELSKMYGIPKKSANFINGILDKTVKELKAQGRIKKSGRGLKEN